MEQKQEKKYGELEIERAKLERWPNPYPNRDYLVEIYFPEFTCKCPRSGYPDFAKIYIKYIPDKWIVELKSLKLWLNQYRDKYISHEAVTNEIYTKLWEFLKPRFLEVIADFHPRGNVHTVVKVSSRDVLELKTPPPRVDEPKV